MFSKQGRLIASTRACAQRRVSAKVFDIDENLSHKTRGPIKAAVAA